MRKLALAALAWLGLFAPALAQINTVPQLGLTTGYVPKVTYSAGFFGLVPPASATDMVCITGSASKTVRVHRVVLAGTAGTLVTLPVQVVRRVSVDTGGTLGTTTANPNNNIAKRDAGTGTASAVLSSYTAVPTINDSAPTYLDSALLTLNTTAVATNPLATIFEWSRDIENLIQVPVLAGAAAQLCVNFNAVSVSSGVLNGSVTWSEE